MKKNNDIDQQYIWHPFEMPESYSNLHVDKAYGSKIYLKDGTEIIDAISSWWITIHGHSHPVITKAIQEQANNLHHVMFAGFTHQPAVDLAQRLITKLPDNQAKLFFSDNGSTAVEVAIKLCIQYWKNLGVTKTKIIALENGYHGDTFGAMSAGARSVFSAPFNDFLFDVIFLPSLEINPQESIDTLKSILQNNDVACFIFEPLIQGAGGMKIYPVTVLDELIKACHQHKVPCIADEVMTGFGKTGKWFASDYLNNKPDLMCLSKALTGGSLPLAVTSCTTEIFSAFDATSRDKGFFHGHTYTGNPLACAAAVASFDLLNDSKYFEQIGNIHQKHQAFVSLLLNHPKALNPRTLGSILAFEVETKNYTSQKYLNPVRDQVMEYCLNNGVLIRPLGNTVYISPPYTISDQDLLLVYDVLLGSLDAL